MHPLPPLPKVMVTLLLVLMIVLCISSAPADAASGVTLAFDTTRTTLSKGEDAAAPTPHFRELPHQRQVLLHAKKAPETLGGWNIHNEALGAAALNSALANSSGNWDGSASQKSSDFGPIFTGGVIVWITIALALACILLGFVLSEIGIIAFKFIKHRGTPSASSEKNREVIAETR